MCPVHRRTKARQVVYALPALRGHRSRRQAEESVIGPTCTACDDAYPDPAVHESCAAIRIACEGNGWEFGGMLL
jgi:hypothetical protein